jgi:hypothetical protein
MATSQQRYKHAALAYLIYGLIYLGGAIYVAQVGIAARAMASGSFIWFLVGAAITVGFPILIYKGFKWFTRVVVALLLIRIGGLIKVIFGPEASRPIPMPWGGEVPLVIGAIGFLVVTLMACIMLARAAWDLPAAAHYLRSRFSKA